MNKTCTEKFRSIRGFSYRCIERLSDFSGFELQRKIGETCTS